MLLHVKTIADSSLFVCIKIHASLVAFMLFDRWFWVTFFSLNKTFEEGARENKQQKNLFPLHASWLISCLMFSHASADEQNVSMSTLHQALSSTLAHSSTLSTHELCLSGFNLFPILVLTGFKPLLKKATISYRTVIKIIYIF